MAIIIINGLFYPITQGVETTTVLMWNPYTHFRYKRWLFKTNSSPSQYRYKDKGGKVRNYVTCKRVWVILLKYQNVLGESGFNDIFYNIKLFDQNLMFIPIMQMFLMKMNLLPIYVIKFILGYVKLVSQRTN